MLLDSGAKALISVARNEPPSHFYEYRDLMICAAPEKIMSPSNRNILQPPITMLPMNQKSQ